MSDSTSQPQVSASPTAYDQPDYVKEIPNEPMIESKPGSQHWDTYNITHKHYGDTPRKDYKMSEGINTDKVIVNAGGGGDGGLSSAAMVAALGNRNESSSIPALIAAMGNRNENHRDDGFGGSGMLGLVALLALLRGRGGFGGDDGGDCGDNARTAILQTLMEGQSDLRSAVPTAALETQNAICRSTGEITNAINQSQLASLAAFSNLKDSVTNTGTILLGNANQNTKEILGAICSLSSKIDQNQILDLQRQLGVAQADAAEERNARRVRDTEINVTQNVNQQQAQIQSQRQTDDLLRSLLISIAEGNQVARATNQLIAVGNTGAVTGTQTANPTNVRA